MASLRETELEYRQQLDGCNFVFDADVELDGETCDAILQMLKSINLEHKLNEIQRNYYAVFVVVVSQYGSSKYTGGTFWPQLGIQSDNSVHAGGCFISCLKKLGLRVVEAKQVYVANALIHAGFSTEIASELFDYIYTNIGQFPTGQTVCKMVLEHSALHRPQIHRFVEVLGDEAEAIFDEVLSVLNNEKDIEDVNIPQSFEYAIVKREMEIDSRKQDYSVPRVFFDLDESQPVLHAGGRVNALDLHVDRAQYKPNHIGRGDYAIPPCQTLEIVSSGKNRLLHNGKVWFFHLSANGDWVYYRGTKLEENVLMVAPRNTSLLVNGIPLSGVVQQNLSGDWENYVASELSLNNGYELSALLEGVEIWNGIRREAQHIQIVGNKDSEVYVYNNKKPIKPDSFTPVFLSPPAIHGLDPSIRYTIRCSGEINSRTIIGVSEFDLGELIETLPYNGLIRVLDAKSEGRVFTDTICIIPEDTLGAVGNLQSKVVLNFESFEFQVEPVPISEFSEHQSVIRVQPGCHVSISYRSNDKVINAEDLIWGSDEDAPIDAIADSKVVFDSIGRTPYRVTLKIDGRIVDSARLKERRIRTIPPFLKRSQFRAKDFWDVLHANANSTISIEYEYAGSSVPFIYKKVQGAFIEPKFPPPYITNLAESEATNCAVSAATNQREVVTPNNREKARLLASEFHIVEKDPSIVLESEIELSGYVARLWITNSSRNEFEPIAVAELHGNSQGQYALKIPSDVSKFNAATVELARSLKLKPPMETECVIYEYDNSNPFCMEVNRQQNLNSNDDDNIHLLMSAIAKASYARLLSSEEMRSMSSLFLDSRRTAQTAMYKLGRRHIDAHHQSLLGVVLLPYLTELAGVVSKKNIDKMNISSNLLRFLVQDQTPLDWYQNLKWRNGDSWGPERDPAEYVRGFIRKRRHEFLSPGEPVTKLPVTTFPLVAYDLHDVLPEPFLDAFKNEEPIYASMISVAYLAIASPEYRREALRLLLQYYNEEPEIAENAIYVSVAVAHALKESKDNHVRKN